MVGKKRDPEALATRVARLNVALKALYATPLAPDAGPVVAAACDVSLAVAYKIMQDLKRLRLYEGSIGRGKGYRLFHAQRPTITVEMLVATFDTEESLAPVTPIVPKTAAQLARFHPNGQVVEDAALAYRAGKHTFLANMERLVTGLRRIHEVGGIPTGDRRCYSPDWYGILELASEFMGVTPDSVAYLRIANLLRRLAESRILKLDSERGFTIDMTVDIDSIIVRPASS